MSKLLFIFTLLISQTSAAQEMKKIEQFFKDEIKRVEVFDSKNEPVFFASHISQASAKTPYVFILLHGLYESPNHLKPLHEELFKKYNQNTVTLRLPGHFDKKIKMESLKFQNWIDELSKTIPLFLELGEKAILIGHSTGGLLQTYFAFQFGKQTEVVVALSGAFEISWWGRLGINIGSFIGYDTWDDKTQRRKIAKLGDEVISLKKYVFSEFKKKPDVVENMKILFVDSKDDSLIPAGSGLKFFSDFKGLKNRQLEIIDSDKDIGHRAIVSAPETFQIINKFLGMLMAKR